MQGGISVLLECDLPALLESICIQSRGSNGCPSELIKTFNESNIPGKDFFNELETNLNEKDIALIDFYKDYFGEKRTSKLPNSEVIEMLKNERDISIQNAIRIIKTRLNSTGLGDPNIQQLGNNRINIELAGVTEKKRIMGTQKNRIIRNTVAKKTYFDIRVGHPKIVVLGFSFVREKKKSKCRSPRGVDVFMFF